MRERVRIPAKMSEKASRAIGQADTTNIKAIRQSGLVG